MRLAIIIPAYNEETSILSTIDALDKLLKKYCEEKLISKNSYLLIVDDGSEDKTWETILKAKEKYSSIKGIKFSKNFGNQYAIIAGYKTVEQIGCDGAVIIDADLQQDETKIKDFILGYKEGYEIVCGVRKRYHNKYGIKSICSNLFYKTMGFLGVNLKPGHSEYRLLGKKAINIINQYEERNIFVRGMILNLGLKTKYIEYDIKERKHGKSKFNFISLSKMAVNAIVSFSARPLRFVFFTGAFIAVVSTILAVLMLISHIFEMELLSPSITAFEIWETFATGAEILCIGVIGEYIGQILIETKGRPRYIIDDEII